MLNNKITILMTIIALFMDLSHGIGSPKMRPCCAKNRTDTLNYHLPESVFPEYYTLKMSPQFNNKTFIGYVKILVHVKIPTEVITLHAKNLNITKEKIYLTTKDDLVINIKGAGATGTTEQEFYSITFNETLTVNTYYLHIPEFYGVLNNLNNGFYHAEYTDENGKLCKFATTHFEATFARCAFPCFDEPSFRAKFKIYIIRPSNYNSVSNTKLIKSTELNNSLYEDEYESTVSMPTYLVAFIVSQMKLSFHPDTSFYRILARPDAVNNNYEKYALKQGKIILRTLEDYFQVNYSLDKMDQAAIPDEFYTAGAMENWGLITYRETAILVTPRTTTTMLMYIDTLSTHELVHQWFGNLVTIKWWRYLWLKEGFARFFESKIIDKIKPEWRRMEHFIVKEKQAALKLDSSIDSRDMNHDAGNPTEISGLYDVISYEKAACVIHMLETFMTPSIFQGGLTNYLRDKAFQAAVPMDLYRNLQKSLDNSAIKLPHNLSIEKIMTTWDSQIGYPLVYVIRNYDKNENVVKLKQSRCIDIGAFPSQYWYIPINYATKSNPNFNDTQCTNWLLNYNEEIKIKDLNRDDWLILNKQEAFYYRVNYDKENWKLITKALLKNHSNIHVLNRAQIIDDSFNLAIMDKLDFSIPLEISTYLYYDDEYITQYAFLNNMIKITRLLNGAEIEINFQNLVIRILRRTYRRLGCNPLANDTQIDKLQRLKVVDWMCKFNYSHCRTTALETFNLWKTQNGSLPLDLEEVIMCNAIRKGNKDDWNYLFMRYHSANRGNFKMNAFQSLGCSEDALILTGFLYSSLNPLNDYNIVDVVDLISKIGLVGTKVSMKYVAEQFNIIKYIIKNENTSKLLTTTSSYFTTDEQLDEFKKLLQKNKAILNKDHVHALRKAELGIYSNKKLAQRISNSFNQMRSSGNLYHTIPDIFAFASYSLIVTFLCL